MLTSNLKPKFRFGPYEVDFVKGELRKYGTRLRVQSKPLGVLQILVENAGEVVTRETLRERLWVDQNVFVDFDKNLSTAVNKLRETLCDSAEESRYIETVPKRGYRIVVPVEQVIETGPTQPVVEPSKPSPTLPPLHPGSRVNTRSLGLWLALLITVAAGLGTWFYANKNTPKTAIPPALAVLPFANQSSDANDVYFSDGLSEEVITNLGRVSGLKVVGRNSSFQFRQRNIDVKEVGRQLGVDYLVTGGVLKIGDKVRVKVEVVKASDGFQVWTENYESGMGDILRVEDEISSSVVAALSAKLLGDPAENTIKSRRSVNPEAYQAFLQARYFKGRWIVSELTTSLTFLKRSLQLDPNYAPAWALQSSVHLAMGDMGVMDRKEALSTARDDAERAIQLEPNLSDGYVALAAVQISDFDSHGAETTLKKAIEAAPRDPAVMIAQANLYRMRGQIDECIELLKKAAVLDPLSSSLVGGLGNRYYYAGRYHEALVAQQRALELNPQSEFVHLNRAQVFLKMNRPKEALADLKNEPGEIWGLLGKALVYHDLQNPRASDAAIEMLKSKYSGGQPYLLAEIYAHRNQPDAAFAWLNRAYAQHDSGLIDIEIDPMLSTLRDDPRFDEVVHKMGLELR